MSSDVIELPIPPPRAFSRIGFIEPDHVDVFAASSRRGTTARDVAIELVRLTPLWIGRLYLLEAREREIILGANGRHYDVRISVVVIDRTIIVVSTLIRFHTRLGRAFFALVRPFHRRGVPRFLREVTRLEPDPARISSPCRSATPG